MANRDIKRAKSLLKAAEHLYGYGDMAGVAGIAYQSFESAIMALNKKHGKDKPSHVFRRDEAKKFISDFEEKIDLLWEFRNIDFYGDIEKGKEKELNKDQIKESLEIVKKVIELVEKLL